MAQDKPYKRKQYYKVQKVSDEVITERRGLTAISIGVLMENKQAPWQHEFDPQVNEEYTLPFDVKSKQFFKGYNLIELIANKKADNIMPDKEYITFDDVAKGNYHLKKGSKSIPVEHYAKYDMNYITDPKTKRWQFSKVPSEKYIAYKKAVFSVNDLNGKFEFKPPDVNLNGIEFTKKLLEKTKVPVVKEENLVAAYYAPRRDEIHIGDKESYKTERDYYADLLRQTIRSLTKPGRLFAKGTEGFAKSSNTSEFVRDKFRVELATMQMAMILKMPYKPTMSPLNDKQVSYGFGQFPNYLVNVANDSSRILTKAVQLVLNQEKKQELSNTKTLDKDTFKAKMAESKKSMEEKIQIKEEQNLTQFITQAINDGKISDRKLTEMALKGNFKELAELSSDIKRRHLINVIKKEVRAKDKEMSR